MPGLTCADYEVAVIRLVGSVRSQEWTPSQVNCKSGSSYQQGRLRFHSRSVSGLDAQRGGERCGGSRHLLQHLYERTSCCSVRGYENGSFEADLTDRAQVKVSYS